MGDVKHPLASIGVVVPAVALIVWLANQIAPGLGITEADASGVIDQIDTVLGLVGGIYGRWKATKAISTSAPIVGS